MLISFSFACLVFFDFIMREISWTDGTDLKLIDNVKNQFKLNWLEERDLNEMFLSDWARKVDIAGKVLCVLCSDLVSYGSGGKKDLMKHPEKKTH